MVRRYGIQDQVWLKVLLPLSLLFSMLALTGIATPGGMAYKPIRKDPPWPPICQVIPASLPCGLLD